jgi:dihydropteroate synthase
LSFRLSPVEFQHWLAAPDRRPIIMGVLNVTPDSFSDGGLFSDVSAAVARAQEMAEAGAAIIDIGGESSRPNSQPVDPQEQIRRVVPVVHAIRGRVGILLSVDTTRARVVEAAIDAGADMVNDVSAGRDDPELLKLVARRAVPIALMHMQGSPATMQTNPTYNNVTAEVMAFLSERITAAVSVGVDRAAILVDPGIGFGKTTLHNLQLLKQLNNLKTLRCPLLVGTSRKRFIGEITGEDLSSGRPFGTAATVAWAAANGADVIRVHDVGPMAQVVRMIEAIQSISGTDFPPIK